MARSAFPACFLQEAGLLLSRVQALHVYIQVVAFNSYSLLSLPWLFLAAAAAAAAADVIIVAIPGFFAGAGLEFLG